MFFRRSTSRRSKSGRRAPLGGWHLAGLVALASLGLTSPGLAQPTPDDWYDCWQPGPAIHIGGQPLDFVPNTSPATANLVALAPFPGGEVTVDGNGAISLSLQNSSTSLGGEAALVHLNSQTPWTRLDDATGRNRTSAGQSLPIHSTTTLGDLYPGTTLRLSGRNRTLRFLYTLDAGTSADAIGWKLLGVGSFVATPSKIEAVLAAGEVASSQSPRRLRLFAPRAWQADEEPVDVSWRLEADGTMAFEVGSHDPTQSLHLEATLEHTGFEPAEVSARNGAGGGYYAVREGTSDARVAVHSFDAAGRPTGDTLELDPRAGRVAAMARAENGDLHLLGDQASGHGPFHARVPVEGSPVFSLLDLPGRARGLTLDDSGRLFVALSTDDVSFHSLPPLQELHLVSVPEMATETYAFVELDPTSLEPIAADLRTGPSLDRFPLWIDCDGKPSGGLVLRGLGPNGEHQRIESNEIALDSTNGFAEQASKWGQYLLQWKQFRASYQAGGSPSVNPAPTSSFWTTVAFNPGNADSSAPDGPILEAGLGAAQAMILNGLENDLTVFPGGDPPGGWQYGDAHTLPELAIAAALYLDKTSSPLAARLKIANAHRAAVITAVELCLQGGFTRIQDLIPEWNDTGTWGAGGENPIDIVDGQWAVQYGNPLVAPDPFEVVGLDITHWPGSGTHAMNEDQSFTGNLLTNLFQPPTFGVSVATDWVADPPETAPAAADVIRETATRLAPGMLQQVEATHQCFAAGELVHEHQETAFTRFNDLASGGNGE